MEKKKYYFIYQTTNKINGKIYVGKHETYNLEDGYVGSGKLLWEAIKKYGIENFERKILFFCENSDELKAKEAEIVNEEFVLRKDTYNLKVGGDGGWDYINAERKENPILLKELGKKITNRINSMTLEEKKEYGLRISNGLKEYYKTHDNNWVGKHHSKKTKEKISLANTGKNLKENNPMYKRHWYRNANDETKLLAIKEGDPVPEGWIKGKIHLNCRGRRMIINSSTKKIRYIHSTENIPDGWERPKRAEQMLHRKCKYCGAEFGTCKHPEICKSFKLFPNLNKIFGLDLSKFGTEDFYQEFYRIVDLIVDLYINRKMSVAKIKEHLNYTGSLFGLNSCIRSVLKKFAKTKMRNASEKAFAYYRK